jgi:glycosyltransferase involved in cell wall biosynthesis
LRNVTFTGYLKQDALLRTFEQADVCYAQLRHGSGFSTAFPTKLLEYMAAGRPIVYGGRGPTAELLKRIGCALVIDPDSATAIVNALRSLSASAELRENLGSKGRAYVERESGYDHARRILSDLFRPFA